MAFPFFLPFSRTRQGIPRSFGLFLDHFEDETFDPYCPKSSRVKLKAIRTHVQFAGQRVVKNFVADRLEVFTSRAAAESNSTVGSSPS